MQEMIRDMQSSIEVQNLANLGYFDEEFQFYGCAYQINGQIQCLISEREEAIYDFSGKSMTKNIYPSPIMSHLERSKLPSGQKEAIKLQFKLALVDKLKTAYPPLFFDTLATFTAMPANDGALDLLLVVKKRLRNCFQTDDL